MSGEDRSLSIIDIKAFEGGGILIKSRRFLTPPLLMQHWTNDRFWAITHRVINDSGRDRGSLAFSGNTYYHALIECIGSCCSVDRPACHPPVLAGDSLMAAIKRTYAYA